MPCENQELPNLHAPGGPIPAFPILQRSPGSLVKPPVPVPSLDEAVGGANNFVDDVLPQIAKQDADYQRRIAELSGLEAGK